MVVTVVLVGDRVVFLVLGVNVVLGFVVLVLCLFLCC